MFDLYRMNAPLPRAFESVFDTSSLGRRLRLVGVTRVTPPAGTDTFGSRRPFDRRIRDTLEQVFDLRALLP
jgi:hypothetical protein